MYAEAHVLAETLENLAAAKPSFGAEAVEALSLAHAVRKLVRASH